MRVNRQIQASRVLLVGAEGEQVGDILIDQALEMAGEAGLDLVEVAGDKNPPVCRIINYGKYRFEQQKKDKDVRKNQKVSVLKEIKLRPKIDTHDYETKKDHIKRFLGEGNKVKVTVMFRGREMAHVELGSNLLERLSNDLKDQATVERKSKIEENNMVALFSPKLQKEEKSSAKNKDKEVSSKEV